MRETNMNDIAARRAHLLPEVGGCRPAHLYVAQRYYEPAHLAETQGPLVSAAGDVRRAVCVAGMAATLSLALAAPSLAPSAGTSGASGVALAAEGAAETVPDLDWSAPAPTIGSDTTATDAGTETGASDIPAEIPEDTGNAADEQPSGTNTMPDDVYIPEQNGDEGVSFVAESTAPSTVAVDEGAQAQTVVAPDAASETSAAAQATQADAVVVATPVILSWDASSATLTGTATAGCTVQALAVDGSVLADTVAWDDGSFSLLLPAGTDLSTVSVVAVDVQGNVSAAALGSDFLAAQGVAQQQAERARIASESATATSALESDIVGALESSSLMDGYSNGDAVLPFSTYLLTVAAGVAGVGVAAGAFVGGRALLRRRAQTGSAAVRGAAPSESSVPMAAVTAANVAAWDEADRASASGQNDAAGASERTADRQGTAVVEPARDALSEEGDALERMAMELFGTPAPAADEATSPAGETAPATQDAGCAASPEPAAPADDDDFVVSLEGLSSPVRKIPDSATPQAGEGSLASSAQGAQSANAGSRSSEAASGAAGADEAEGPTPLAAPQGARSASPRHLASPLDSTQAWLALAGIKDADLSGLDAFDEASPLVKPSQDAVDGQFETSDADDWGLVTLAGGAAHAQAPEERVASPQAGGARHRAAHYADDQVTAPTEPEPPVSDATSGTVASYDQAYAAPVIGPSAGTRALDGIAALAGVPRQREVGPAAAHAAAGVSTFVPEVADDDVDALTGALGGNAAPDRDPGRTRVADAASGLDLDEPTQRPTHRGRGIWGRRSSGRGGQSAEMIGVPVIQRGASASPDAYSTASVVVPDIPDVNPMSTLSVQSTGSFLAGLTNVVNSTVYVQGAAATTLQPDVADALSRAERDERLPFVSADNELPATDAFTYDPSIYDNPMTSPAYINYLVRDEFEHRHDTPSQRAVATSQFRVIDGANASPDTTADLIGLLYAAPSASRGSAGAYVPRH